MTAFKLNLNETFPHLKRAPIAEAVIHWHAKPQKALDSESLRDALSDKFKGFGACEPIHHVEFAMLAGKDSSSVQSQQGWQGYRLTSEDKLNIIQVRRDGVAYSRLAPYLNWEDFTAEALRNWRIYREIATPTEVQRLGIRFINRVPDARPETLVEFLADPPSCPDNLPLKEFIYQSTFDIPDEHFAVRLIKVMQTSTSEIPETSGLFIDSDVSTTRPIACDDATMNAILPKMRWLKNKVFFSLLTAKAIESFK